MAYTAPQIGTILLKADRTMYKIGQIAYENMFAEDNEALDYERDVIFIYKKAVEFADDFFVGTDKLDNVVERLAVKISAYDYGELSPIYADAATVNIPVIVAGAALNDLSDVTITNLLDNQIIRYNAATGQWINVGPGAAVRNSQAFTATAGQTVFTTAYPFDAGLFDLYVNGVKLNSLSYTTFGEYQITLNDPCIVGDIIDVVIYDPNTSITPSVNSLDDLSDVALGPLANNQVLYYNAATGLWQNALLPSLTGYIPYTGATTNVDLGEFGIMAGQFTLDTSPTGTATVGTTRWNDTAGVSETTLKGGSVIVKNSIDLVARVVNKVTPDTTLTKASYAAVRISGAQGQRLAVAYAQANNDANSADTIGLVCETIPTNQEGFIMTVGQLEDINTTGSLQGETWVDGDVLYLSPFTPGAITKVKPIGNGHIVVVGYVEYAHAIHGKIYVKTMNGWELDELHDVSINTGTLANGDVLKYNSTTQLWENGISTAGISGSGASGQITYWTGASAVSGSTGLLFNSAINRLTVTGSLNLGVNTQANSIVNYINTGSSYSLGLEFSSVNRFILRSTASIPVLAIAQSDETARGAVFEFYGQGNESSANSQYLRFVLNNAYSITGTQNTVIDTRATGTGTVQALELRSGANNNQLILHNNGHISIGSSSSLGTRLGVVGDTLLRGSGATSATTALTVQNSSSTNLLTVKNDGPVFIHAVNSVATLYMSANGDSRFEKSTSGTNGIQLYGPTSAHHTLSISSFNSDNYSNGALSSLRFNGNYVSSAGSTAFSYMLINGIINQTGTSTSITRGLYVNPTLTAAADFRAIETSAGNVLFGSNFFWDNANGRLGIGTNAPAAGSVYINNSGNDIQQHLILKNSNSGTSAQVHLDLHNNAIATTYDAGASLFFCSTNYTAPYASALGFWNYQNGPIVLATSAIERLRVTAAGNLSIGSTSDNGQRLQVYGDTLLRGSGNTSATTALTVQNSASSNLLRILNDGTHKIGNQDINIFSSGNGSTANLNGRGLVISTNSTSQTDAGALKVIGNYTSALGTDYGIWVSHSFTNGTGGVAIHNGILLNQTINQTGGANGITRGLYVNPTLTSAADFRAIETTNGKIVFGNLPTSSAGLPTGALWNDAGTVKIV